MSCGMLRNVGDSLHSVVKEREHAGSIEMRCVATGGKKEMPRVAAKITLMLPSQKILFLR